MKDLENEKKGNVIIFGDTFGIPMLLEHIPKETVSAIVCATNRPSGHNELERLSNAFLGNVFIYDFNISKKTVKSSFKHLTNYSKNHKIRAAFFRVIL